VAKPDLTAAEIRRAYAAGYQAGRKRAPVPPGKITRLSRGDILATLRQLVSIAQYKLESFNDPRLVRAHRIISALQRRVPITSVRKVR
jgi:hypothetical protein